MISKIADYIRYPLYAVLIGIIFILFQKWDLEHPKPIVKSEEVATSTSTSSNYIPQVNQTEKTSTTPVVAAKEPVAAVATGNLVHVQTDVLSVDIDTLGGNIIQTKLLKYAQDLHSAVPVLLLNNDPATRYVAQSGLLSSEGPDTSKGQALYKAEQTDYLLLPDQNTLVVPLSWQNAAGVKVSKLFTFQRNSYQIDLKYQIQNNSSKVWQGNHYAQLLRTNTPVATKNGLVSLATYFGAAVSSPDKPFEKISFKEMQTNPLNRTITGGWAAMIQHYFVSAWIPDSNVTSNYYSRVNADGLYTIGMINSPITVKPAETIETKTRLFVGPSITDQLKSAAPNLQLTIDYGWFWIISVAIFWMMQKIYNVVGNWGWSIVLVTVIIKLMFYHLSAKSYRSMSGLKKLQPKIEALRERIGNDKQKFTQATLELYKKEKVNPMSGCLPILVQIPVFIALYWVLVESVELRHAPFILWIHDLSTKDPYYILPLLMGLSMFLQQRLSPPPPDPMQAKVLMFMPVVFTILFLNFPAGLMLYWFVNNILSFAQQWFIMRGLDKDEKSKRAK